MKHKRVDIDTNIDIYIVTNKKIKCNQTLYFLPRQGEILQYNGISYLIIGIKHHYKEGFKPYIELITQQT